MEAKAREAWSRFIREEQTRALRSGPKSPKPLDEERKLLKQEVPAVSIATPDERERYVGGFKPAFRHRSTMQQALLYLLGLLSDLGRRNGETIEAAIPGATQQGAWDLATYAIALPRQVWGRRSGGPPAALRLVPCHDAYRVTPRRRPSSSAAVDSLRRAPITAHCLGW
jgi:hypothetical protein